ncbi:MAG: rRNA adenine dimethyltransferase family protein [Ilumatobacter sp.]
MSDKRSSRDRRRRELGQNFLADERFVRTFIDGLAIVPGELVVDIGAGSGALTRPLAAAGARVWAVERDPEWVAHLRRGFDRSGAGHAVRVIGTDIRHLRLPREPFRVVANPPFGLTTEILPLLLDRPERGPERADLIVQREVAHKHAQQPSANLRSAAWAPWWEIRSGPEVPRGSFRPIPSVDAAVLVITKRSPAILPTHLSPKLRELLRPGWS